MAVPEQQQQQSLRIGDVIFLHSKEGRGYVFSESSSSEHLTLSVLPVISPDDPNIPDLRMAAFKVIAPNKNKAQERLAKLKRKQHRDNKHGDGMVIQTAEKNAKIELKNNELEQERQKGTPVLYGSVIQLLHIYSNKYVTISTVQTSKTENTNMQMYLLSHDSENCLFRILPRYKVRSVGDEVRMEDQVTFSSEKTEGQYIHTSGRVFRQVGISLHENCHEVNASATESGYTVKSHYRSMPNEENSIKGGSIARLFHRELESYLVAEGSFANEKDEVVIEEVHLRKRKSEHGKLKASSTSAITYWQIEKDKEPLSGQVVSWGERCRIKHLPTRLYLAIVKEENGYTVTLKRRGLDKTDLDTVFRLFPVIEEDTGIQFDSYARISHPHTKTWLVARKGERYTRQAFDPNAPGLASLQWDSAELVQIGVQDQMSYDDAFTIEQVDDSLIQKFTYVAGVVPVFQAYIKEKSLQTDKIGVKKSSAMRKALGELADFMKYAHPRMKDHQKLLRNLMIIELIVRILEGYDPKASDARNHQSVCQACYKVIEVYLLGQSRKNENYLARFISFFEQQIGMGLNAEQMLTELVRDNSLIVSKFDEKEVDAIIKKLIDSKDHRFFDYLGVLCVCNDRPIPENQDMIIKKLVLRYGEELFYLTEVRDVQGRLYGADPKREIQYYPPKSQRWYSLAEIAAKGKPTNTPEYQFLVAQLDLFGKLCKGNNTEAVRIIDKELNYLTFDEALTGAKDDMLHPSLRSKYVELIVVLYVDVGNNRALLDNLPLSFIYKKIVADPYKSAAANPEKALTGVKNEYFPKLKDWILQYVTNITSVIASSVEVNNLNAEILDLLYLLVKYGYYAAIDDINALIVPLVSMLNGMNDKLFPDVTPDANEQFTMEGRFEDNYTNRAIFKMKVKALKVMDLFFNFRFYLRLQHFIYDYKLLKGDVDPNEIIEQESDNEEEEEQATTEKHSRRFGRFLPTPAPLQQLTSGITQQVTNVTHQVTNVTQQVTHQVSNVTQQVTQLTSDLIQRGSHGGAEQYPQPPDELKAFQRPAHKLKVHNDDRLMSLAAHRLKQIFSLSWYKCDGSVENGQWFHHILIDLSKYKDDELLHESLHFLGRFYSAEENLFEKAIQTQLLITSESETVYSKISSLLPTLRHLAVIDVDETQCQELVDILEELTLLCHLEGDENEPHKQNQTILYNTGVFADVLNLIFRDKSTRQISSDGKVEIATQVDSSDMKQREEILSKCLQFLRLLAKNNLTVQERLFDRMDDLLELDVAIPDMAEVLTEIFTGGQEICLKLKEQQVEHLFYLIAYGGDVGRAELLGTLQAAVKVEHLDLPLKRNQAYIMKYFGKMRDKFCNELLGLEEEKVKRREQLLVNAIDEDPNLKMLLKLIDLLASCSEGENLFIESICQNIMSVNELLKILSFRDLSPPRKRPFVRFLLWVYMNTGGDKIQTGSIILFHDGQVWAFLEHIRILLDGIVRALKGLPDSEAVAARSSLTARSVKLKRRRDGQLGTRKRVGTMSAVTNVPFVTSKEGELVPGLLIYLMEGIVPMLKVFYAEYFRPFDTSTETTGDSDERISSDREIQVSAEIASALLYLADCIKNFLSSQEQWDLLRTTILTILNHGCFEEGMINVDPAVRARFENSVTYNVTSKNPSVERYEDVYQRERSLNDEFNNFVRNYELAYWGPNTAQRQIGSPYKIDYSEFEDKLLDNKGDEWLPLGPSFQQHVTLYVDRGVSESKVQPEAKRIVDCLESSYNNLADIDDEKERQKQDRNDIRYLYVLRTIIHNEIMFVDPDLREEGQDPVLFRKLSERVVSVQNQIQSLGSTVERIVKLLSHPNEKIAAEVLAFLSILLYTGNKTVQKGFSYLMHTREEKLFVSMQQRLQQAAINDRERRTLLAQLESREEAQKVLRDTFVTHSARGGGTIRPTAQEALSLGGDIGMSESTEILDQVGGSRKPSTWEDTMDVANKKLLVSGEAYEMQQLSPVHTSAPPTSGRSGRLTITDPNYSGKKRKKRADRMSVSELLAEAGLAENEIQLQKLQEEYDKKSTGEVTKKSSSLQFKDTSYIELALRVLGLLCDGQYRPMQNYLREQPDNIKTINLVSEICIFLSSFYVDVTKDNIVLITQVLKTMIEMSVGNFANQQVLFNHQIVDTINRIMQTSVIQQCSLTDVLELKQAAIELLEVMCEETDPGSERLVKSIFKGIDVEALQRTLVYFYKLSQDQSMKEMDKDDDAERAAFRTYHALVHMADFEGISLSDVESACVEPKDPEQSKHHSDLMEAWNHCKKWSKSIEVFYHYKEDQKVLAKVHFRSYPADELPEEIIEKVKYQVNRESPEDKTRDFLEWMMSVKKEIHHLTVLRGKWYTNMFVYNLKMRNYLLILWTLVMNIMLVIAWSDVNLKFGYTYNAPDEGTEYSPDEMALHTYCLETSCYNNNNILSTNNFTANNCTRDLCAIEKSLTPSIPENDGRSHWFFGYALYIGGGIHLLMSIAMVMSYFLINSSNFVLPEFFYTYVLRKERTPTYSDEPLLGLRSLYHIMFVACSALSLPFYGYFYCVCLLHIVIDNDILQRVLKSVTKNGRSLLWVAALGLVVLYIYSVGTFAFLANEFHEPDPEEPGDNVRFCRSLIQCFISVLEYGLLDTLGLTVDLPTKFKETALRVVFFDLTFFIIVTTIGLNIVFGIIVDTFSELRDERWRIEEDKKGNCFICNIASYEFERKSEGFDHHVKHEHSMWNYIYFYLYLERIDVSDHNAIESYAYHQIKNEKTDLFPLFQARSLKEGEDDTSTQLAELREMVAEIMQHFRQEKKNAAIHRKREEHAQWEREQRKDI